MNRNLLILIALFFLLVSSTKNKKTIKTLSVSDKEINTVVTPFKPLLFNEDHNSEGFLATLKDGRILLIFRVDPSIKGDHVGRNGYIAKIMYDPEMDKWGDVKTVYNSNQYDDRNIHGGITNDGKIIIFFRKFDGRETEGHYFIHSDDNGLTWSDPESYKIWSDPRVTDMKGNISTGKMFYNPDIKKYMMLGFTYSQNSERNYTARKRCIIYSRDGVSREEYNLIHDDANYKLNEIAGAWCGKNRILTLQRDDEREHGHPFVQIESYDNGQTWTQPKQTNIPTNNHWGAAPQIIYNEKCDLFIALASDRYSRPDEQSSLFIYTARPNNIMGNPKNWTLQHELLRPWAATNFKGDRPLNLNFYGYPTIAPINDREYLIVFTKRSRMHGTEQADLYYFKLIVD